MSEILPKGLTKRGGVYHLSMSRNGMRIRRTLGAGTSLNEAKIELLRFRSQAAELKRNKIQYALPDPDGAPWQAPETWIKDVLARAKRRSKQKRRDFNLTADIVRNLFESAAGRCQVTGIPFTINSEKRFHSHPFMPSIDRINSSLGYVDGNVRLVCYCVNIAMSQWGEVVLEKMAKAYMLKTLQKDMQTALFLTQRKNLMQVNE